MLENLFVKNLNFLVVQFHYLYDITFIPKHIAYLNIYDTSQLSAANLFMWINDGSSINPNNNRF